MSFEQAWLAYKGKAVNPQVCGIKYIYSDAQGAIIENCIKELQTALEEMTGRKPILRSAEEGIDDGTEINSIRLALKEGYGAEEYHLLEEKGQIVVEASEPKGVLYGTFALIRQIQLSEPIKKLDIIRKPAMPLRMMNHWDNMDGSIERGYSGNSFFFKDDDILVNDRTITYARLMASIGINAVVINNVNVKGCATWLVTEKYFAKLKLLFKVFAGYGIKLYLSLNFAAPMEIGGLDSADPLSDDVRAWWKKRMEIVFNAVPNLGGFLIKADSEGRPGPFTYGRTHAEGANMLAEAVAPFHGLIIWRCFVYNCEQDWRDRKTDRARSGYDNFIHLDGEFLENVILQIKNGPMDFQVREPVHPLFGSLERTNQMLEVQAAQEYTGQQRHICYLVPMFKQVLDFRTYIKEGNDAVRDIVSGKTFGQVNCGMAAVSNTGNDDNWTGHDLAAANLYGFGRLAFEPELSAQEIAREWIRVTYGRNKQVEDVLMYMLLNSWPAYEKYTSPLGIGWMVNPNVHYGPNVDGYEYDRWGTYHRADHLGIGVDRSHEGTGYACLYREPNASIYDDMEKCPDDLLLFFHHVPYTWKLRSGKTVIQHIYDTHFGGVEIVDEMTERFLGLEGKLPDVVYGRISERLTHQKAHAREWRDQINSYFYRKSGIPDESGRKIY